MLCSSAQMSAIDRYIRYQFIEVQIRDWEVIICRLRGLDELLGGLVFCWMSENERSINQNQVRK